MLDSNTSERGVCTASVPSHAIFFWEDGDKGYAASPGIGVRRSMHLCRKFTGGASSSTSDDALNATGDARRSEEPLSRQPTFVSLHQELALSGVPGSGVRVNRDRGLVLVLACRRVCSGTQLPQWTLT